MSDLRIIFRQDDENDTMIQFDLETMNAPSEADNVVVAKIIRLINSLGVEEFTKTVTTEETVTDNKLHLIDREH